jgi:multiple sugar transport system ATP-binding protein
VIGRMRSDMQVAPHSKVPFAFNMDKAVFFDPKSELRIA